MQLQKQYLHELLKQDQEPFHLKNYIAHRRSQLKNNKSHHPQPESNCLNTTRTGSDYLRIPAATSDLLLEAATRIKKKQGNPKPAGLFSSVFKKLKEGSSKIVKAHDQLNTREDDINHEEEETATFYCSCNFSGRPSSGGLSESNESSWKSDNSSGEIEYLDDFYENHGLFKRKWWFLSSPPPPLSPQSSRFLHPRNPSSRRCSSVVLSSPPAISPCRRKEQDMNVEVNSSANIEVKEQSSPVSVLEPQLEIEPDDDDDDQHHKQDYDAQCSFSFVDRAKEELLQKLLRFEKLANLDPVELEKRMVEQLNDKDQNESIDEELEGYIRFEEEKSKPKWLEKEDILLANVCRKMDCLGEEISMTIDMMVQRDFKNELDIVWKTCQEQRDECCMQIELAIFGFLVEEFVEDLMVGSICFIDLNTR